MWHEFSCKFLGEYNSEKNFENRLTFASYKQMYTGSFFETQCITEKRHWKLQRRNDDYVGLVIATH